MVPPTTTLHDEGVTHDLMSYGGWPEWISRYTWDGIAAFLGTPAVSPATAPLIAAARGVHAAAASAAPLTGLHLNGHVTPDGVRDLVSETDVQASDLIDNGGAALAKWVPGPVQLALFAVVMLLVTMLCWGSWANTQKLTSEEWAFQLYYWDYAFGVVLVALVLGFTMGSMGTAGRPFVPDLMQASWGSIGSALLGGVVFNLANLLLVAAIEIAGMAVAFPVGIGLATALGVVINYVATPLGDPVVLFVGVGFLVGAIVLDALSYRTLPQEEGSTTVRGLVISLLCGILMGLFYRFVAASMAQDFVNPAAGKMGPYAAVAVFSVGLLASNFVWNTLFMRWPLTGKTAVSFRDYLEKGTPRLHAVGLLGGGIWNVGMAFSIIASGTAGFAISYGLGQGATLVAALWGVFVWKEFENGSRLTTGLLTFMFLFYLLGLGLIIYARVA